MRTVFVVALAGAVLTLVPLAADSGEKDDTVVISPKEGGWTIEALMRLVSEETGESIVYDPEHPGIANKRIEFVGQQRVPRDHLFKWFQSLLSFQRIILVPVLGGDWMAVDMQSSQARFRPVYVPEEDLAKWADRRGVFLVTTVALESPRDGRLVAELLAPLVTREVGSLNHVPTGTALVIADYAPKVVALVRLARRLTAERTQRARRYEELLAAARTETAAEWFRARLEGP